MKVRMMTSVQYLQLGKVVKEADTKSRIVKLPIRHSAFLLSNQKV